ncbi:D-3-phosphoglycerate dehydrogenase [Thalassobaculum fulvum]|uniref:D-3-phosphoglycerate dehydrogenase n=1 Tax=Thalassobaculum fulvum TaxID=1633335 RepID=A0A918XQ73_9PROT|nr:hydroxyacid dehydrogenase [Thalassobaculum fulvum]GHD46300.1 D-3-phosphoglycerate dehydrogenase [Thalassobaculum fulvum]
MASNKKKVLVLGVIHPEGMALLEGRDDVEFEVLTDYSEANVLRHIEGVHGIAVRVAPVTRRIIEASGCLEVVSRHGVGYDAVDVAACTDNGVRLTIAPRANAPSVAEQAMMFLLVLAKQLTAFDPLVRRGDWARRGEHQAIDLEGRTLLVVGLGRIGSRVVRRARAFDMRVLGYDPYIDQDAIRTMGAEPVADFRAVLSEVDAVTVHCPRNAETIGIVGAAELAALRKGALVVNCARGGLVDEAALLAAVRSGQIAGAGMDVFDVEPPAPDHPFFQEPRILMTPHSAGASLEALKRSAYQTIENILATFDGTLDPAVVVNKEVLQGTVAS